MNYLSVENLSKSFGEKTILNNVTFGIAKGEKVALVAKNGAGKSTLLKIMMQKETADSGTLAFRNGIIVSFLEQEKELSKEKSIIETVLLSQVEKADTMMKYEMALLHPENEGLTEAMGRMDELNLWDFESSIKELLGQLGLTDFLQPIAQLSGGQLKRLCIAQAILSEPDFLLLDEPTNHLDTDIIEWLEEYLQKTNTTILMVTHDRYFLEKVCNVIIELEDGNIYRYEGNYSMYLEKKEERRSQLLSEIDKAKNLFRKELDWMRRQPQARGTKAKYRIDAFGKLQDKVNTKINDEKVQLDVIGSRLGKKVLEMTDVSFSYEDKCMLQKFSYLFKRNEKVGIVGPNGVGKSTFLNLLCGKIQAQSGIIDFGETVKVGYYNQSGMKFPENKRVIEVVTDIAEFIDLSNGVKLTASKMLERFLFPAEQQYSIVSKLSGGERRRLYLLTILMQNPNFLILDEPTNDLDILTLTILEDFLESFPGCLMIVSHDRFFLDRLADHLFVFEGSGIVRDFNGNYSDYREYIAYVEQERKEKAELEKKSKDKSSNSGSEKPKLSFKEKKEFDEIEAFIAKAEKKKAEIESKLSTEQDIATITALSAEYDKLIKDLDAKSERWLELSELM